MIRIVFVCLGNICRSPMAEAIMKKLVADYHIASTFIIESRATSTEEIGNPIYKEAQNKLIEKGILDFSHYAKVFSKEEYGQFDYIVVMEDRNTHDLLRIVGNDSQKKIRKLIPNHNVSDPWYSRDFERAYQDIYFGCSKLLEDILRKRAGEE